jgi:hypothetical protein
MIANATRSSVNRLLLPILLLGLLPMPASSQGQGPAIFASAPFAALWARTDWPVSTGSVKRTWFWGPQPNTGGLVEEYKEGVGGKRTVQYFDKSRMEINDPAADPNSPFYVTNGLLTVELISGRMQTGNNSFTTRQPSRINVTGDAGDTLAPTYADLSGVSNALQERRDPRRTGQPATATLSKDGKVGSDPSKASVPGVAIAYYEETTGHNIPQVMWDFLNSSGPVSVDGKTIQARLIEPWFYASGLPISDPYWIKATIAGKATDVLLQAYERRVLTYVPTNPEGFKVEMGNIGQHYYQWRYSQGGTPVPAPTQAVTATATPAPLPTTLSRFAVDLNGDFTPATLDKVKAAGAGAVRIWVSWSGIQANKVPPEQFQWSTYDEAFKATGDRGLQVIALIEDCPAWACSRRTGPIRGEHVGGFVEFMAAMSARYGKPPYNVHYWEFWNEPDSTSTGEIKYNWGTYGARYAAMLKAVRPAMRAADPAAQLVLGGVAYDNFQESGGPFYRKFVDDLLDAGGGQYLDAFNFHYYVQNIHWCSFTEKLGELRGKLTSRGLNIPIISTETGFTSDTKFGSNDDMQSLYVAQVYAQSAGEGMLSTTWFLAKDFPSDNPAWGIFQKSGLLTQDGAPKPSHQAYRAAVEQIGQRPASRRLGAADGVAGDMRGYEFGADAAHAGPLWVVWAWDLSTNASGCGTAPAPRDFIIPGRLASNLKRALDIYGQPLSTRTRGDGSVALSLDARPVYLEWAR